MHLVDPVDCGHEQSSIHDDECRDRRADSGDLLEAELSRRMVHMEIMEFREKIGSLISPVSPCLLATRSGGTRRRSRKRGRVQSLVAARVERAAVLDDLAPLALEA